MERYFKQKFLQIIFEHFCELLRALLVVCSCNEDRLERGGVFLKLKVILSIINSNRVDYKLT